MLLACRTFPEKGSQDSAAACPEEGSGGWSLGGGFVRGADVGFALGVGAPDAADVRLGFGEGWDFPILPHALWPGVVGGPG